MPTQENALARLALAAHYEYQELGNDRFFAEGGVFIRNRAAPEIMDANFVSQIHKDADLDRLLDKAREVYTASRFL